MVDPKLIFAGALKRYEQGILAGRRQVGPEFLSTSEHLLFLAAISQLQAGAREVGAAMVVVCFPHREGVYARFAIQDIGASTFGQIKSRNIAEFCKVHGILYRNMSDAILSYRRDFSILSCDVLPYLDLGGHPSEG